MIQAFVSRLLEGFSVVTKIPYDRLPRVGKVITFGRTHEIGRTRSSICNRPAAQQSPPREATCEL